MRRRSRVNFTSTYNRLKIQLARGARLNPDPND